MKRYRYAVLTLLLTLLAPATAWSQTAVRIRGTITEVQGNVLAVKTREGQDLTLRLADKLVVAVARPLRLADLKPGDYVGGSAVRAADGALEAHSVHTLAATVAEGHGPWDLLPGSTMTNATIAALVTATGQQQLTLKYQDGAQTIRVPNNTPMATTVPGDRSALKPGEYVFVAAQRAADGTLTALQIQVSRDGVRPPQ